MLFCGEAVTLVRHNKGKMGDAFTCIPVAGASWFAVAAVKPQQGGVGQAGGAWARIPEGSLPGGVQPQPGDYLVRGTAAAVGGLSDLWGREFFKIASVRDNRRGRLRHWAVRGA